MYSQQTTTATQQQPAATATPIKLRSGKALWVRHFDISSIADYEAIVRVDNAIDPDHADAVENWQHWDRHRNPAHHFRRFIAERDGEVVAFGHYGHQSWSFHEDKYSFWVGVHPDHQRKGYGSALWDYMYTRLLQRGPGELVSYTRENRSHAVQFLENRGFEAKLRAPISRINPQTFDPAPFAEKCARVAASGIVVKTLAELREEAPDWQRRAYELDWECGLDVPSVDVQTKQPFEEWVNKLMGGPNFMLEGWFIAVDGDEWVGLSCLWRNSVRSDKLGTGLTGVKRSHRRRGVATAMKVRALTFARDYGAVELDTDNEENNPMLQ
ncbi:MAG: GNAT family N-acetyltransferase, partial [Anaerolineae bacterium]|nr:GNAT family N-acetyltransferase [Anaerolineae bacterium]